MTEEHRVISSLESEVETYVQTLFSYGGTSTTGLQNYWQEIYQLIASGTALEEIDEVPYFQGMSVNFMNKESVYDLPSYHIGRWYLVLCGVGGGAFSPRGNSCMIGWNRFSQKIQGLEVHWMVSFNGIMLAKEGQ
ncbi:MAG: hypothetical protein LBG59_04110 [Candidatus Peribacteria bacterium]|nr:hypothetical protein [Candidatus Peribacteria bacterium]